MRPLSLLMIVFFAILYFVGVFAFPMMEPDEGRYNSIASQMVKSGDYLAPKLDSVPYLLKPPLHHWLTSASFCVLGNNHLSGRFFPSLFTLLTALVLFFFLKSMVSERAGYLSLVIYLSSVLTIGIYDINILDQGVAFFVCFALVMSFWHIRSGKSLSLFLFWVACALGILEKGLIGIVLPVCVVLAYSIWKRQFLIFVKFLKPFPILVFLAIVLPWFILIELRYPGAFNLLIIREHFARYTSGIHNHREPIYFLSLMLIAGFLPWTTWFVRNWKSPVERTDEVSDTLKYLLCWGAGILLFFSISSSQLIPYLTPVLPAFCGILGVLLATREDENFSAGILSGTVCILLAVGLILAVFKYEISGKWLIAIPVVFMIACSWVAFSKMKMLKSVTLTALFFSIGIFALTLIISPLFMKTRSIEPVAKFIQNQYPENVLVARFNAELPGLGYLLNKDIVVLGSIGEMEAGIKWISAAEKERLFPRNTSFEMSISRKQDTVVVMKLKDEERFLKTFTYWKRVFSLGKFIVLERE